MKTNNFLKSSCRHCRYFNPEGRRGGGCQKLGVPVQGNWQACVLARSPFSPTWKTLEEIVHLETAYSANSISPAKADPTPKMEVSKTKVTSL